jgi:uncharacterized membrane protein
LDLLVETVALRPYVFLFLAAFFAAGARDVGVQRTLAFGAVVWPIAWLAEFSSTRIGIPFGLYHYTGTTSGQELYIGGVPFMDSLSFTFLAYASFCLARAVLGDAGARGGLALVSGALMMLLDVVIDPLAVRGDRWFLGRIFYYPSGGVYFGVPLSNFLGWLLVGAAAVGGYLALVGEARGRHRRGGVALYYAVVVFNVAVTVWIREWFLAGVGVALHGVMAFLLRNLGTSSGAGIAFGRREVQSA